MPFLDTRDVPVYYETKGEGPALVFAHGAGGNAAIWFNQIAHFSDRYQVITFDHRCFGRTPVPDQTLSVHDFRDDLLALLDTLDIESAHLVGQSMGGFTVLRTALDAPDRTLSLTLSSTSGGIYNPDPPPSLRNLTTGDNVEGVKATMSQATKSRPELMQLYESINNFNVNFDWAHLSTLLGKEDVVQHAELANVRARTLIIAGQEDPLFPVETLTSFVPYFNDGRIEVIANAGHSPYFEQPDVYNPILAAHLEGAEHG